MYHHQLQPYYSWCSIERKKNQGKAACKISCIIFFQQKECYLIIETDQLRSWKTRFSYSQCPNQEIQGSLVYGQYRQFSSSHRTTEWFGLKGTLKIISLHPPCHEQEHFTLGLAAQSPIQSDLEHCQGGGSHSFPGQSGPGPHHPHGEEFLPSNLNLPTFSLQPFPLVLLLHAPAKSPSPSFL